MVNFNDALDFKRLRRNFAPPNYNPRRVLEPPFPNLVAANVEIDIAAENFIHAAMEQDAIWNDLHVEENHAIADNANIHMQRVVVMEMVDEIGGIRLANVGENGGGAVNENAIDRIEVVNVDENGGVIVDENAIDRIEVVNVEENGVFVGDENAINHQNVVNIENENNEIFPINGGDAAVNAMDNLFEIETIKIEAPVHEIRLEDLNELDNLLCDDADPLECHSNADNNECENLIRENAIRRIVPSGGYKHCNAGTEYLLILMNQRGQDVTAGAVMRIFTSLWQSL